MLILIIYFSTSRSASTASSVPVVAALPDFVDFEDRDIGGFDIEQGTPVADLAACKQKCLGNPNCYSATFNSHDKNCWMKKPTPADKVYQGIKLADGSMKVYKGFNDYPGFDLNPLPVKNVETMAACTDLCKGNPDCKFVNYVSSVKDCWLKRPNTVQGLYHSTRLTGMNFE